MSGRGIFGGGFVLSSLGGMPLLKSPGLRFLRRTGRIDFGSFVGPWLGAEEDMMAMKDSGESR
jgi:hypothetical protein